MRGDSAISPSRSSEKSMGSTELRRRRSISVSASSRRIRSGQPHGAARLAAPAAQVDAAQHDFAIAPRQPAHLFHHLVGRGAAAAAAHERDDAEGAAVVAAVLNLQIGAGAVAGGIFHGRGEKIALGEDIAHVDVAVVRGGIRGGQGHQIGNLRSCASCPPPIRRRAWRPVPRARAAHSSRSPGCAPRGSRGARGGWSGARRHRPRR